MLKYGLEESTHVIINSISSSSWRQYESSLRKWTDFANLKQFSVFSTSPENVTAFLSNLVSNVGYSSVNTARSAISLLSTNSPHDSVGSHPVVKRFIKGAAKLKPPKPRYDFTWDASQVTIYLKTLWPHSNLTLSVLSEKCVMLIALCTAHRCQTLSLIKLSKINFCDDKVEIFVEDVIKTSGPGKLQPRLVLPIFSQHPYWCAFTCLQDYISCTKDLRDPADDYLFLSISKPVKPVGSQTISRWIKNVLSKSGVDTTHFTRHSVRHASTSKAFSSGVSIDIIRQRAGWSKSSETFARFYNKPIISDMTYAKSVFNLK